MPDELKSAWEVALEKLEQQEEFTVAELSEEQKASIAEIRQKYQARIAEAEINSQSKLKRVMETGTFEEAEVIRTRLTDEKRRLTERMEKKIGDVRAGKE